MVHGGQGWAVHRYCYGGLESLVRRSLHSRGWTNGHRRARGRGRRAGAIWHVNRAAQLGKPGEAGWMRAGGFGEAPSPGLCVQIPPAEQHPGSNPPPGTHATGSRGLCGRTWQRGSNEDQGPSGVRCRQAWKTGWAPGWGRGVATTENTTWTRRITQTDRAGGPHSLTGNTAATPGAGGQCRLAWAEAGVCLKDSNTGREAATQ